MTLPGAGCALCSHDWSQHHRGKGCKVDECSCPGWIEPRYSTVLTALVTNPGWHTTSSMAAAMGTSRHGLMNTLERLVRARLVHVKYEGSEYHWRAKPPPED